MNYKLQKYARTELKAGLAQLHEAWQMTFKRMYSHHSLNADINQVVYRMPQEKLDWAMQQVERSIDKLDKKPQK